jgi:hypothetical protein
MDDDVAVEIIPPINPVIATGVLSEIDSLIEWQRSAVNKAEKAGIRLARLIADVAANKYWETRGISTEKEYIKSRFPQSESQYYILKRIGSSLRMYPAVLLEEIGISKCQDLVRIQNHCGQIGANWFIWAKKERRDDFRKRVQIYVGKCLPAPKEEEGQFVTYRIWTDAVPVISRAQELSSLESGSENKSHNYILREAEFCAGHNEEGSRINSGTLALQIIKCAILSLRKFIKSDPSIIDRLIGVIRSAIEELKGDSNDSDV